METSNGISSMSQPVQPRRIREKMREWWEGSATFPSGAPMPRVEDHRLAVRPDLQTLSRQPAGGREAADQTDGAAPRCAAAPSLHSWSDTRQVVVQRLFGEGFLSPGGEDAVRELVRPLGLNPNHSVAEIGAGMGAVARQLAREGIWVDAYEPSRDLVEAGLKLAREQKLGQRANLRVARLDDLHLRKRSLDAVISKEGLLQVADKRAMLAKIRHALRPGGQVMFTDYLRTGPADNRVFQVWQRREPGNPEPLSPQELEAELNKLGFDIAFMEDVSPVFKREIIQAFAGYDRDIRQLPRKAIDEIEREWVIAEGEHWAIRISAMDAAVLRLYRVYCRTTEQAGQFPGKEPEKPPAAPPLPATARQWPG